VKQEKAQREVASLGGNAQETQMIIADNAARLYGLN